MPGISVLTLVKNRTAHLSRLIEGLDRGTEMPEELIVADMDGDWTPPPATTFPVRVVAMPTDGLPLAEARNAAAAIARSERLLFLDVDCVPMKNLVHSMSVELASADRLVCVEVRYLGPGAMMGEWTEDALLSAAKHHPARRFPIFSHRIEPDPGLFWSLAFGIRRRTFQRLGGFDPSFQGYGAEDTDFGFRAAAAGVALSFLGGTGAFHQHHETFVPPLQHFDDIVRNATVFYGKWRAWPMQGWLEAFEKLHLIRRTADTIVTLRRPDQAEIARSKTDAFF